MPKRKIQVWSYYACRSTADKGVRRHIINDLMDNITLCGKDISNWRVKSEKRKPFPDDEVCPQCLKIQKEKKQNES